MQKVITLTLDTFLLLDNNVDESAIWEIDSINSYLMTGWEIQEWEILRLDEETKKMLLWVVLTDDIYDEDDDDDDDLFDID